ISLMYFIFFFFFQAEDGIRDRNVTGVQTCALPISRSPSTSPTGSRARPISARFASSARAGRHVHHQRGGAEPAGAESRGPERSPHGAREPDASRESDPGAPGGPLLQHQPGGRDAGAGGHAG